jgi:hypothetical protein
MGLQKALYRAGFAIAIFAFAAACSSTGASPIAQHSPTGLPQASSTATTNPTDSPGPSAAWKTYVDSTVGIRFSYPAAWAPTTSSGYTAVASPGNVNLVLWMSQPAGGMTLEKYKPIDLARIGAAPDNQSEVHFGGIAGWAADWHVTNNGQDFYIIDSFTVRNDKTYDFMWMSAPGHEDADFPLFQQIESTVTFTN